MGDRTGTLIFCELWSIAKEGIDYDIHIDECEPQPDLRYMEILDPMEDQWHVYAVELTRFTGK